MVQTMGLCVKGQDTERFMAFKSIRKGRRHMKDDYISIAEFARIAGVSPAAVYKRVNNQVDNQLLTHMKIVNGKKRINKAALELFNSPGYQPVNNQSSQLVDNQLLTILQENMDVLKGELEVKNKQIEQLNKQNDRLNDRLQESNQLNHQNQILLEQQKQSQIIEEPTQPAKKSFWDRFKKKE